MKKLLSAVAVAAAVFLPAISQATIVTGTTGLTTYDKLVTFSTPSVLANTVVTNQYAAQGLTFTAVNGGAVRANSCASNAFNGGNANIAGDYLNTFGSGCVTNTRNDSFSMLFANDVSAASIAIQTNLANSFAALLNGAVIESFNVTSSYDGYLKFSNIVFDEIRFTESNFAQGGYVIFDNVAYVNAVPEPTTVALLGLGLLGFAASRRKTAKK